MPTALRCAPIHGAPARNPQRGIALVFVLLMLATSIMSSVGAEELLGIASRIQSDTFRNFEIFVVLWVLYLGLSYLMRAGFWLLGQIVFTRRRKLGTPL